MRISITFIFESRRKKEKRVIFRARFKDTFIKVWFLCQHNGSADRAFSWNATNLAFVQISSVRWVVTVPPLVWVSRFIKYDFYYFKISIRVTICVERGRGSKIETGREGGQSDKEKIPNRVRSKVLDLYIQFLRLECNFLRK